MASYTDNPQLLSQFNPYIQQLPVEAMKEVGMYKQQQYNEGIQKIQTNIDNIAGLDVIRGVDRKYLQSKINALGNNLKLVAAGDFSDFQLVNSTTGMVNQVAKDKYVQNAVSSSAKYRKEVSQMESDIREGKSSPENQWDFSVKSNEWLQSDDINKTFSDRYTKYTDVNKKMLEVFKSLHPNLRAEDLAYVTTNGKVDYTKAAAVMQRVSHEAVSANQIENAIRANLDANDLNQMGITGRYTFKDMPPENIERYYTQEAAKTAGEIDRQIAGLQQIVNTSASDPITFNKAKEAIENLESKKTGLSQQLQDTLEMARKNPDLAKAQIYKEGAISQFAAGMSWENAKLELMKSPVKDEEHWQVENALNHAKFNLDINKNKFDQWYKGETLEISRGHLAIAGEQLKINAKKALKEIQGPESGADVYFGESTKILKDPNVAMMQDISDIQSSRNQMIGDLAKQMNVSPKIAMQALDSFKNGDVSKIPVTLRNKANNILEAEKKALNYTTILEETKKEAANDPVVKEAYKSVQDKLKKASGLNLNLEGKLLNYSAKELYDYLQKNGANLTPKEKQLDVYHNSQAGPGSAFTINKVLGNIREIGRDNYSAGQKYKEKYNDILLTKTGKFIPAMYNIDVLEKDGSRGHMEGIAKSLMMVYGGGAGGQKGGRAEFSTDDNTKASAWLNGKERGHLQYKKVTQGEKTFLAVINGAEEVLVPVDKANERLLPRNANELSSEEKEIKYLQLAGKGNTNLTGNPVRGHFGKNNFISTRKLSVTGDLNASDTGEQYINLNLKLPNGRWQNLQLDDFPLDTQTAINTIKTLTDTQIKDLYLKNPNVPESVKEQIRTIK